MPLITDSERLAAFCRSHSGVDFISVDTEFMRDRTYWPRLCLMQIAGPGEVAAVDTLAPGLDLAPVLDLMFNPRVLKVFHAARQDLEIFYHLTGRVPTPLFDTQVAAMVCGYGDSIGYETIAAQLAGARIDKSVRFTDWSARPLSERQVAYALADVTHLRRIYLVLGQRLAAGGRAHWLREEMETLLAPSTYRLDPIEAWRRLKPKSASPRMLALLREVAAWREREAQDRDVPRNRVLRDETLMDIAAHAPRDVVELVRMRGVPQGVAEGRVGQELLAAVARACALSPAELPEPIAPQRLPRGIEPIVELLKVLLKLQCEEHDVAQRLVASSADLEQIAADDAADVPALHGWRREVFGEAALALKHGRLGLALEGKRVVIVPLQPAPPKLAASGDANG